MTSTGKGLALRRSDLAWAAILGAVVAALLFWTYGLGRSQPPTLRLGPLTLYPFGPLLVADILFGWHLARRWCERYGPDWDRLSAGLLWLVPGGIFMSHLVAVALYHPQHLADPAVLLDPRSPLSSFGGIFGGALLLDLFLRRTGLPRWRTFDALVFGFTGGYVFGRAGCFSVHDHPGLPTDLPWAVEIGGVPRHDLGLYEMVLMAALLALLLALARRHGPAGPPAGRVTAVAAAVYAPARFALDALRVADPRWAGLTPGQWLCVPLAAAAVVAWRASRRGQPPV